MYNFNNLLPITVLVLLIKSKIEFNFSLEFYLEKRSI